MRQQASYFHWYTDILTKARYTTMEGFGFFFSSRSLLDAIATCKCYTVIVQRWTSIILCCRKQPVRSNRHTSLLSLFSVSSQKATTAVHPWSGPSWDYVITIALDQRQLILFLLLEKAAIERGGWWSLFCQNTVQHRGYAIKIRKCQATEKLK